MNVNYEEQERQHMPNFRHWGKVLTAGIAAAILVVYALDAQNKVDPTKIAAMKVLNKCYVDRNQDGHLQNNPDTVLASKLLDLSTTASPDVSRKTHALVCLAVQEGLHSAPFQPVVGEKSPQAKELEKVGESLGLSISEIKILSVATVPTAPDMYEPSGPSR